MVKHELYDRSGRLVTAVNLDVKTCETIIVEHGGEFYKPICYEFGTPQVARCVPVRVVSIEGALRNEVVSD